MSIFHDQLNASQITTPSEPNSTAPRPGGEFAMPHQLVRAIVASANQVFRNQDDAFRLDPVLQRQMRNDPDIYAPLEERFLALTSLDFEVEAAIPDDPACVAEARAIERAIRRMRHRTQLIRQLVLGVWFGHSGAWIKYEDVSDRPVIGEDDDHRAKATARFVPQSWMPLHPDSIDFRYDGEPVIKVNRSQIPERWQERVLIADRAAVLRLTPEQRATLVLSVFNIEAPDYEEPLEASRPYAGTGLRARLYSAWYLKQVCLRNAGNYAERHGKGVTIGRYPAGNPSARDEVRQAIENIVNDAVQVWPSDGEPHSAYAYEIHEPGGTGWEIHHRMYEVFRDALKETIKGQQLTSGTAPTGLGSGVADAHQRTFDKIIRSDAATLDEAMTHDLVRRIQAANWPNSTWEHRYRTLTPDFEAESYVAGVEKFVNLGGAVPAETVRQRLGIDAPKDGDHLLTRAGGALDGLPLSPNAPPTSGDAGDDDGLGDDWIARAFKELEEVG